MKEILTQGEMQVMNDCAEMTANLLILLEEANQEEVKGLYHVIEEHESEIDGLLKRIEQKDKDIKGLIEHIEHLEGMLYDLL